MSSYSSFTGSRRTRRSSTPTCRLLEGRLRRFALYNAGESAPAVVFSPSAGAWGPVRLRAAPVGDTPPARGSPHRTSTLRATPPSRRTLRTGPTKLPRPCRGHQPRGRPSARLWTTSSRPRSRSTTSVVTSNMRPQDAALIPGPSSPRRCPRSRSDLQPTYAPRRMWACNLPRRSVSSRRTTLRQGAWTSARSPAPARFPR